MRAEHEKFLMQHDKGNICRTVAEIERNDTNKINAKCLRLVQTNFANLPINCAYIALSWACQSNPVALLHFDNKLHSEDAWFTSDLSVITRPFIHINDKESKCAECHSTDRNKWTTIGLLDNFLLFSHTTQQSVVDNKSIIWKNMVEEEQKPD